MHLDTKFTTVSDWIYYSSLRQFWVLYYFPKSRLGCLSSPGIPLYCPWRHTLPWSYMSKNAGVPLPDPPTGARAQSTSWNVVLGITLPRVLAPGLTRVWVSLEEHTPKSKSHHSPCHCPVILPWWLPTLICLLPWQTPIQVLTRPDPA